MGSALFVELDRDLAGVDISMDGKALARNERRLTALAEALGVPDLWSFYSVNPDDLAAVLELEDLDELDGGNDVEDEDDDPAERWFAPAEGLAVVRALRAKIEASPDVVEGATAVDEDLRDIERILSAAGAQGARWRLAVDF